MMSLVKRSAGRLALAARRRAAAGWAVLVFGGVVCCGPAFAADENEVIFPGGAQKTNTAPAPKGGSLNLATLGVALILAGAGGWFLWRNRRAQGGVRGANALAIEETRSLGNRQYIVVASYEGRKFLLGVCPGQINLLSRLEDSLDESTPHE